MKYICKDCTHNFNPASQFETACPACGSENTAPAGGNNAGSFNKFWGLISKKPNRYILIGIVMLVLLLLKFCGGGDVGKETYYNLSAIKKPDHIQFVIEAIDKDKNGNPVGEKRKLTGKQVEAFGVYILVNSKPVKIDGNGGLKLVDGDKFYGYCNLQPDALQFMIDPKRQYNCGLRSVTWLQTTVSKDNCCPIPVPLAAGGVQFKPMGTNIIITTNLDTIPNHAPIYYSITGKEGPYVEGKNIWDICSLNQIDGIWVTTGTDDTTAASGAFPYVVDKSACPCSAAEAQALKNSVQNAGNSFGTNMADYTLGQKFEFSFIVRVDSDGNGSPDKQITSDPQNCRFIIDGNNFSYMQFQSYTLGLTAPVRRYSCSVNAINCRIVSVTFQ